MCHKAPGNSLESFNRFLKRSSKSSSSNFFKTPRVQQKNSLNVKRRKNVETKYLLFIFLLWDWADKSLLNTTEATRWSFCSVFVTRYENMNAVDTLNMHLIFTFNFFTFPKFNRTQSPSWTTNKWKKRKWKHEKGVFLQSAQAVFTMLFTSQSSPRMLKLAAINSVHTQVKTKQMKAKPDCSSISHTQNLHSLITE